MLHFHLLDQLLSFKRYLKFARATNNLDMPISQGPSTIPNTDSTTAPTQDSLNFLMSNELIKQNIPKSVSSVFVIFGSKELAQVHPIENLLGHGMEQL